MNPFLFDTVAKPATGQATSWHGQAVTQPEKQPKRWPKALKIAGIAALSISGSAYAIDLNTANLSELLEVKGIGPKTAQIIIDERNRAGSFKSFTDLSERVRGIGPKKAQSLQGSGLTIKTGTTIAKPAKQ